MSTVHTISFPGLGLGPFEINQIAFNVLGRDVAWYGIIITLAMLSGIFYAFWRGVKYNNIKLDDMIDLAIFSIPAAMVGARLYFVIFNLSDYKTFYDIIAVWNGGLAVYGGIIFGMLTGFIVCRFKKISVMKVFDSVAPAIMLGQIIGRWGNFANAEAFGGSTTAPWRMVIKEYESQYPSGVHPAFLYESVWNLIGFILINLIYKKKKHDGQIFYIYGAWYGLGRMFIESLREDSLYLFDEFRVSQVVSALCFVVFSILLVCFFVGSGKKSNKNLAYENIYTTKDTDSKSDMDIIIPENNETDDSNGDNNSINDNNK